MHCTYNVKKRVLRQQVNSFQTKTGIFTVTSMRTWKVTTALTSYELGKKGV
jgi:hypothetical protein